MITVLNVLLVMWKKYNVTRMAALRLEKVVAVPAQIWIGIESKFRPMLACTIE